jgi:hypothetical protein
MSNCDLNFSTNSLNTDKFSVQNKRPHLASIQNHVHKKFIYFSEVAIIEGSSYSWIITRYMPTQRPLILPVVLYGGLNLDSHIEGGKQAEGVRKYDIWA